nr:MAG TPA: hypothetical protein [Caudoviricetes sp.]
MICAPLNLEISTSASASNFFLSVVRSFMSWFLPFIHNFLHFRQILGCFFVQFQR